MLALHTNKLAVSTGGAGAGGEYSGAQVCEAEDAGVPGAAENEGPREMELLDPTDEIDDNEAVAGKVVDGTRALVRSKAEGEVVCEGSELTE